MRLVTRSLLVLAASLSTLVGCGDPEPDDGLCPWHRQCGECGECPGSADPCRRAVCPDGWTCGAVPTVCPSPIGGLTHLHTLSLGDGGLPGPVRPQDVAVTQDQQHAYVASTGDDTIVHVVQHEGVWRWGSALSVPGVKTLALAPDDARLYAAGAAGLLVLSRAPETGALSLVPASYPAAVDLVSGNGQLVAVGEAQTRIYTHGSDLAEVVAVPRGGTAAALSGDGRHLYLAEDPDTVSAWRVDADPAVSVGEVSGKPGLNLPNDMVLSHDGARLYVAGFCDNDIAVLSRDPDAGTLTWAASLPAAVPGEDCVNPIFVEHHDDEDESAPPHPSALAIDGAGRLHVASRTFGTLIRVFEWESGQLRLVELLEPPPPYFDYAAEDFAQQPQDLPNPWEVTPKLYRHTVSLTAAGGAVYATSQMSNLVRRVDGDVLAQRGQSGVGALAGAYNLALSPDGRHAYVAPRIHGAPGSFDLDPITGGLTPLAEPAVLEAGNSTGSVANVDVTPDGSQVFTTDAVKETLSVFARDEATGVLTLVGSAPIPTCTGGPVLPVDVVVSPDGRSVYVADFQEQQSCIQLWPRAADGTLGPPKKITDDVLTGLESIIFTKDGLHAYTAAFVAQAVAHFDRDPQTGDLALADSHVSDDGYALEFIALSPDETRLYAASPGKSNLMVYDIEAGGALSYRETLRHEDGNTLLGAAGVVVSPDGKRVYVAARRQDAIGVFSVDDAGAVTQSNVIDGLAGLDWPNGLAITPDGKHLVAVAVGASAINVFGL